MILKRMTYMNDDNHRLVTSWVPGIEFATRMFDEDWQAEVLVLRFADGSPEERVLLRDGDGVYLCNDEGRTIEVLGRLHDT